MALKGVGNFILMPVVFEWHVQKADMCVMVRYPQTSALLDISIQWGWLTEGVEIVPSIKWILTFQKWMLTKISKFGEAVFTLNTHSWTR